MEPNAASSSNLSIANTLYKEAEKFKNAMVKGKALLEKIENDPIYNEYKDMDSLAFEDLKYAENLDEEQKEVLKKYEDYKEKNRKREELLEALEDAEPTKKSYAKNIHIAISKYIVEAEKEINNLTKQIEEYKKHIDEEKSKLAELQEDPEKNKLIIEDLQAEIQSKEKKLKSYSKDLEKLEKELEKNKVKFADYMELADDEIVVDDNEKTAPGDNTEKTTPGDNTEKTTPGDNTEKTTPGDNTEKTTPGDNTEKTTPGDNTEKTTPGDNTEKTAPGDNTEKTTPGDNTEKTTPEDNTEKTAPENKETDAQAFNRIYKLMKSRKTRDSVSKEDVDRMIDIMGDPEKYKELKIDTSRFLKLPFFPSTAEKVFKQIGRHLDRDVKNTLGARAGQELVDNKELIKWESMNNLGYNADKRTKAEELVAEALLDEDLDDKKAEKLEEMQTRLSKFRNATSTLYDVRMSRHELKVSNKLLGEGKEKIVEPDLEAFEQAKKDKEMGTPAVEKSDIEVPQNDEVSYENNEEYKAFVENRSPWGDLVPPEDVDIEIYSDDSGVRQVNTDREEI